MNNEIDTSYHFGKSKNISQDDLSLFTGYSD